MEVLAGLSVTSPRESKGFLLGFFSSTGEVLLSECWIRDYPFPRPTLYMMGGIRKKYFTLFSPGIQTGFHTVFSQTLSSVTKTRDTKKLVFSEIIRRSRIFRNDTVFVARPCLRAAPRRPPSPFVRHRYWTRDAPSRAEDSMISIRSISVGRSDAVTAAAVHTAKTISAGILELLRYGLYLYRTLWYN